MVERVKTEVRMKYTRVFFVFTIILITALWLSCGKDKKSTDNNNDENPAGMVLIEASGHSFQMGSDSGYPDELPVHTVNFTYNFWMDTTEVTQSDFNLVMSTAFADSGYETPVWNTQHGVGARYPAYYIFWGDAVLYCNARSKRDGLDTVYTYTSIVGIPGNLCQLEGVVTDYTKNGYRLPTEAEWEYACRAGSTTDLFWGKNFDPYPATSADSAQVDSYAVWLGNSYQYGSEDSHYGTHQVASTKPNAFGLYDMSGNVYEWINDWYGEYSSSAATDPTGPTAGDWHFNRGGSWGNNPLLLRSANRTFMAPDYQYYFIGFRVVLPVH